MTQVLKNESISFLFLLFLEGTEKNKNWNRPLYRIGKYRWIGIYFQDAPFFVFRLLLITYYKLVTYMNLFFTCKNTLVITLQVICYYLSIYKTIFSSIQNVIYLLIIYLFYFKLYKAIKLSSYQGVKLSSSLAGKLSRYRPVKRSSCLAV